MGGKVIVTEFVVVKNLVVRMIEAHAIIGNASVHRKHGILRHFLHHALHGRGTISSAVQQGTSPRRALDLDNLLNSFDMAALDRQVQRVHAVHIHGPWFGTFVQEQAHLQHEEMKEKPNVYVPVGM